MSLLDSFTLTTVDDLKIRYTTYLGKKPQATRKADIAAVFEKALLDISILKGYWETMPELEQKLMQETIYNYQGVIEGTRFKAKYGRFPESKNERSYGRNREVNAFEVFFYQIERYGKKSVPAQLISALKKIISPPKADLINPISLPAVLDDGYKLHCREQSVFIELNAMLVSLQNKSIKVSDKTGIPSSAVLKKLSCSLNEYYQSFEIDGVKGEENVLAFGWVRLLANSRYTTKASPVLSMSKTQADSSPETIKSIWNDWVYKSKDEEFNRIDVIKGQKGKGKRYFTDVVERRVAITDVLSECKINTWIPFAEFSRHMRAIGAPINVTDGPEYLYIQDPHYGGLYDGAWKIIEESYIRCLLVEYAATLGIVDVVLSDLPKTDDSYDGHWGIMEVECLSRYQGLKYLRLTELGAYILGISDSYQSNTVPVEQTTLSVKRRGIIQFNDIPKPWETQFLSLYAEQLSDKDWELNRKNIVQALQAGGSTEELTEFLLNRETQPFLPEDCEQLLKQIIQNLNGVKQQDDAVIFKCKSNELFELILNDKLLSKLCQPLSELQLVISKGKELNFKNKLNELGIGYF